MQQRCSAAALVAVTILGTGIGTPSRADVTARARVDNLGYRLVDLRPGDGIAPAVRFLPEGGSQVGAATAALAQPYPLADFESFGRSGGGFQAMGTSAFLPGVGQAAARMGGTLDLGRGGGFDVVSRGLLRSRAGEGVLQHDFSAFAEPSSDGFGRYEVTPFTRVVFTAFTTLEVQRDAANAGSFVQLASARIRVVFFRLPNIRETRELVLELGPEPGMRQRQVERQRFVFDNTSGEAAQGYIALLAGVSGQARSVAGPGAAGAAAPVPEAGTAALLLCGLGVVAGAARRARRRGA